VVLIDAPGYQRFRQEINLRQTAWPEVFRIARASETPLFGRAVDEATSAPVIRGDVTWQGIGTPAIAGRIEADGLFRLDVPIAAETASGQLTISASGYELFQQPVELKRGQGQLDFVLVPLAPTPLPTPRPTPVRAPTFELIGFYTGSNRGATPPSQLVPSGGRITDCNPQGLNAVVRVQNVPRGEELSAGWQLADREALAGVVRVEAATFTGSQLATSGLGRYGYRVEFQGTIVASGAVDIVCQ